MGYYKYLHVLLVILVVKLARITGIEWQCPTNWTLLQGSSRCFKHTAVGSYYSMTRECLDSKHPHLSYRVSVAIINDAATNDFICNWGEHPTFILAMNKKKLATGISEWRWIGQPINQSKPLYTNFHESDANPTDIANSTDKCLVLSRQHKCKWVPASCTEKHSGACELHLNPCDFDNGNCGTALCKYISHFDTECYCRPGYQLKDKVCINTTDGSQEMNFNNKETKTHRTDSGKTVGIVVGIFLLLGAVFLSVELARKKGEFKFSIDPERVHQVEGALYHPDYNSEQEDKKKVNNEKKWGNNDEEVRANREIDSNAALAGERSAPASSV